MASPVALPRACRFAVDFGAPSTAEIPPERGCGLALALPLLGGESREIIFPEHGVSRVEGGLHLASVAGLSIGWVAEPVMNDRLLSEQTQALYSRMLEATKDRQLYRIWNYVPRINSISAGLENYRAFCLGRSLAFEAAAGESFSNLLPAASAVGIDDSSLAIVFVSGEATPHHFENPEQIPAYRYPPEHGPRAPSFSRATVVQTGARRITFISGTSAIKGHVTIAPGTLTDQLDCTVDNLRLVSKEAGAGPNLGGSEMRERHFKVYLRHASDLAATRSQLERDLLRPGDRVTYLRSDICRAALRLEIEATLVA